MGILNTKVDYQEYVAYDRVLSRRAFAAFLDYFTWFWLVMFYVGIFGERGADGSKSAETPIDTFFQVLMWFIYFPVVESIFGYTLFKRIFHLRVVREKENLPPLVVSFLRHIVDVIDFTMFGVIGIVLAKVTKSHKRLGDLIAHTQVIYLGSSTAHLTSGSS